MEVPSETESEPEPEYCDSGSDSTVYTWYDDDDSRDKVTSNAGPSDNSDKPDQIDAHVEEQAASTADQNKQSSSESESDSDSSWSESSAKKKTMCGKRKRRSGTHSTGKRFTGPSPGCSKQLASKQALDYHTSHIDITERSLLCPDCEFQGKSQKDFRRHRLRKHYDRMPGIKLHTCPHPGCGKQFVIKSDIDAHFLRVHVNERPFPCSEPNCEYRAKSIFDLSSHVRRIHSDEKPFSCSEPDCGFRAKFRGDIRDHIRRVHWNERPFPCPEPACGYSAKTKKDLNRHIKRNRHISSMISCDEPGCGFKTVWQKHMRDHQEKVHRRNAV
jgi:KRAB domain-containing zinc finger protein